MKPIVKQFLIWVVIVGALIGVYAYLDKSAGPTETAVSFSEVLNKTQAGQVKDVTIEGTTMTGHYGGGAAFRTMIPANDLEMYTAFREHGVNVTTRDQSSKYWLPMAISVVPFLLVLGTPCLALLALLFIVRRSRVQHSKST